MFIVYLFSIISTAPPVFEWENNDSEFLPIPQIPNLEKGDKLIDGAE